MNKRLMVVFFVLLFFSFFSKSESFSKDSNISMQSFVLTKSEVLQGSFFIVIGKLNDLKKYYIEISGKRFDFYRHIDYRIALVGIDLNFKSGVYDVSVYNQDDNNLVFSKDIKVIARKRGKSEKIVVKKTFDYKKVIKDRKENARATAYSMPVLLFSSFDYPIKDIPRTVTSSFGRWRYGRFHRGIDYSVKTEDGKLTSVYSVATGIIVVNRKQELNGRIVIIDHGGYVFSYYLHLSEQEEENQARCLVFGGDKIGVGGATGRTTGPHLHLGIKIKGMTLGKDGVSMQKLVWIDPEEFIEFWKNFK